MKANRFKATTHACSECGYRSLLKCCITRHLKTNKCEGARCVTKEQIVSHHDEHEEEVFKATLYQCGRCAYTTYSSKRIDTHVRSQCVEAEILKEKRILCFVDIPVPVNTMVNNNPTFNTQVNNNAINVVIISTDTDEGKKLFAYNLAYAIDSGKLKIPSDLSDLPAIISNYIRSTDPRLDDKYLVHNDVISRITNEPVDTCVKHSKKEVFKMMSALYDAVKSSIDIDRDFMNFDPENDDDDKEPLCCEDVVALRREFISVFFNEEVECVKKLLENTKFATSLREEIEEFENIFSKYSGFDDVRSDFFKGCELLISDPYRFKTEIPKDVQYRIRIAARKYLSSMPQKTISRSNNTM